LNVAGYAVCDGGLMIDMSLMNAVRIAPGLDRAYVEGGATWADVDAATTPFSRATPGGLISMTGVAGLTLSGGIGWLRGTHGLSCDNIIAADVVIADGRLIHASDTENPDLLWALKGGGGNFGVVVNFEFRLHPIAAEMMFCAPAYPEERANEILPQWRDYMANAPDQVSGLAEFSTIPRDPAYPEDTWGIRVLALATVYDGPAEEGERLTRPLRSFGEPLLDFSERMPYRVLQTLYDGLFPKGRDRCYWKSTYLRNLNEDVIEAITARLAKRPSEMTYASLWKFGGAAHRCRRHCLWRSLQALHAQPRCDLVQLRRRRCQHQLGSRCLARYAAAFHGADVPQLPWTWRRRPSRAGCTRCRNLCTASGDQKDLRSGQRLPNEPEYSAAMMPVGPISAV
jgi:hypothetical protein